MQQSLRHAEIRAITGTTGTYNEDWHALFDLAGIAAGPYNQRLLAWINQQLSENYTELNGAMAAYAAASNADTFQSTGNTATFTLGAPEGVWADDGDGTHSWTFVFDPAVTAGMFLKGEYSDDDFATVYESVSHELTSGDIAGTPFAFTTGAFVDGTYKARFWTTDAGETINSAVGDEITFTVVNLLEDTALSLSGGLVASTTNYDFATNLTLGAADPGLRKMLVLMLNSSGGVAATHVSATLYPTTDDRTNGTNGLAMTLVASTGQAADTASTNFASIWEVNVGSRTSGYVRLVTSDAASRATMRGWTHGRGASTDFIETGSAATLDLSGTIDVPANGIVLVHGSVTSGSAATATATGYTETYDELASGTLYLTGGKYDNDASADTGGTIQPTWTVGSNIRLVASAYGDKVLY